MITTSRISQQHHPTKLDIYIYITIQWSSRKRERRKAGDIYKHCGTARPIIPSEGREREMRKPGDIHKHCVTARPIKSSEGREREENI